MNTESLTKKSGHLAWCALIALHFAKSDGQVNSEYQENVFLTCWLATALKQHRFPRETAPDIVWLLKQGRTLGPRAKMRHKLDYLWRSCTGELSAQNDLFRLTYALETAKEMHWVYRRLTDREWTGRNAVAMNDSVNAVYLLYSSLNTAFDDDGNQIPPLMARITGNVARLEKLLDSCSWQTKSCPEEAMLFQLMASGNSHNNV
ncbi:DUF2913 domain-containing protein [Rahnella bruchi]|uniref:DUF2913 family protein n=1 Tax=Rahnella bruchi TaxID=1510573 RepID=UPI000EA3598B|nr:DUF2913 family protein [Rahnella bruchi]